MCTSAPKYTFFWHKPFSSSGIKFAIDSRKFLITIRQVLSLRTIAAAFRSWSLKAIVEPYKMRRAVLSWLVLTLAVPVSGCSGIWNNYDQSGKFDVPLTYTTSNTRVVMERINPVTHQTVVCTEPAPDSEVAFSSDTNGNATGGNGAVNAGVGFGVSSSEAAAELAGRSTALLGLRDGLYRTCEAYANGVIGADAYALVLSRYGQLMTTLFLGQDVTGAAGVGTAEAINATPQAPGSTTTTTTAGGSQAAPPTSKSTALPSGGAATQSKLILADTGPSGLGDASLGVLEPGIMDATMTLAAQGAGAAAAPKPAAGAGAAGQNAGGATPSPGAATTPGNTTTPSTTTTQNDSSPATAAAGVGATAALVLGRMTEDYYALDQDDAHLLLTACINELDPTRIHALEPLVEGGQPIPDGNGNIVGLQGGTVVRDNGTVVMVPAYNGGLYRLCEQLDTLKAIDEENLEESQLKPSVPPIDPGTVPPASAKTSAQNRPATAADPVVEAAQQVLTSRNFYIGPLDGILGPLTQEAIKDFQSQSGISATGQLDSKTKAALGLSS